MAAKPATLAALAKLGKQVADLEARRKKVTARAKSVRAIGDDAITKSDMSRIAIIQTALKGDLKLIDEAINVGKGCRATLGTVQEDEDFVAEKLDAIDKLTKTIDDARDAIGEAFAQMKELQNELEAKSRELEGFESNMAIKMAGLEKDLKELSSRVTKAGKDAAEIWAKAVAAHEGRDAKALAAATERFAGIGAAELQAQKDGFDAEIERYREGAAKMDARMKSLVLDTIKDNEPAMKAAQKTLDELKDSLGRLQKDYRIEPIDTKKALAVLELDAKWLAKLGKALEAPTADLERLLGALAKEAKLAKTGKQMVEALRKAKLV